jgi:hypothetical protein
VAEQPTTEVVAPAPAPEPAPAPVAEPAPRPAPDSSAPQPDIILVDPAAPPRVEPGPGWDAPPPATTELAQPFKLPKSGTGNIVNGASMIGAGLTVAVPLGMLGTMAGGDPSTGFIFTLPALLVAGGGGGLLALGIVRERKVARWSREEGITPPPSGKGLMAGGVWLAVGGSVVTVIGTQMYARNPQQGNQRMAAGIGASVIGGAGLVAWGAVRQVRRNRWTKQMTVTPYAMPTGRGFSLGVAGRF